jgi:hypothetical protein
LTGVSEPIDQLAAAVTRLFLSADPVPAQLLAAASASLSWREADAALAELVLDSAVAGAASGVRSSVDDPAGEPRLLSFALADLVIDVELTADGQRVELIGQVSRPESAMIEVRYPGGTRSDRTDLLGRFRVPDLPPGPLRVTWTPAAGSPVATPSFLA